MNLRPKFTWLDITLATILAAALSYSALRIGIGLDYPWNWDAIPQFFFRRNSSGGWTPNLLMEGFINTIRLSVWGTLLGSLVGFTMGMARTARAAFPRMVGLLYVGLIRNIPPLVLILIFYFFIGDQLMPVLQISEMAVSGPAPVRSLLEFLFAPPHLLTPFLSGVLALALLEGAYITEIVRAAIESIDRGQWEGASSLGLSRNQQLWYVVLPQALPRMLPPLAGQFISTIKDSAIVSVVSIQELTFQGLEVMAATHLSLEIWTTITILYFLLTFSCSLAVRRMELHFGKGWT
ncbi:MAG: amino acid ABC transporter permease [Desulfuromonadaceae bacterium]|nr:amino acid ABC transporter permease [Desulfuromonadaceae bacterium]